MAAASRRRTIAIGRRSSSRLSTADLNGDLTHDSQYLAIADYRTDADFDVHYYDRTYDLRKIESVDFILVPFSDMPSVAHTVLSFGFAGPEYLAISIEVRRLRGEIYNPVKDFFNTNEIIYVVGDERDLIRLRTNYRRDDVYLYRAKTTPDQTRALFVDMLQRANKLAREPEFYNTVTNNCANNLVAHVNNVVPNKIPYNYQVLFPGMSDRLVYDMGIDRIRTARSSKREEAA